MIMHDYDILKKYSLKYLSASTVYISLKIIEQIKQNMMIQETVDKLKRLLMLNEDTFYSSSEDILNLAKNFEQRFP
jgi:hypothetical protein